MSIEAQDLPPLNPGRSLGELGNLMLAKFHLGRLFLAAAHERQRNFVARFPGADEHGELAGFNE